MNEKEIVENALQVAIPEVIKSLQKQLEASLDHKIVEAVQNEIAEYVKDWLKENLIPAIGDRLMNIKDVFEKEAERFCKSIAETLFTSMIKAFEEKLERSWDRSSIFKTLFGN
jgi:glutamyl-tRNA reductase